MSNLVCTIKILDQVNCRLLNLDPKTRRTCVEALTFTIPNAYYIRSVRLGHWSGKSSFMTMGGGLPLNLLPRVFEIIQNAGYDFTVEDHRPNNNIEFTDIDTNYLSDYKWPEGHRLENQPIILEEHQVGLVNALLKAKNGVGLAGTGAGKTIVTAVLSKKVQEFGRSIIIVPSKDLVEQTEKDYIHLGLDVGVFYGKRKEFNKKHTICTWQSLDRMNEKSKNKISAVEISEFLHNVVMVLVDECHGASSNSMQKLLGGPFSNTPLRWGLTGTIPKEPHLKIAIEGMIGDIVYTVTASELQEKGFLSNCHVHIIQFIDPDAIRGKNEEPKHKEWSEEDNFLANDPVMLKKAADKIIEIEKSGNTFVLTTRQASCENIQSLVPNSQYFHGGKKDKGERQEAYGSMGKNNNVTIVATFGIASTGLNIPRMFNLCLYNPGKAFTRIIQSIGRGLRKAHDKDFVNIYIFCTTNKWSTRHLAKIKAFLKEEKYPFTHTKVK